MAHAEPQPVRSIRKSVLFWLILLILPLSPLLVGEGLLRWFDIPIADDPYLALGRVPSYFEKVETNGRPFYRIRHWETYANRKVTFPAEKDAKTFRIFCLGGSASAGWPHPPNEIYSAYLQQALQRSFQDRTIEVINASAHAYAAYRVRLVLEQVLKHDPDLIILWSGSNEFLENRTYGDPSGPFQPFLTLLNHSAVYRLARGSSVARRFFPSNTLTGLHRDHSNYDEWSKVEQVASTMRSDPVQFDRLKQHYAFSMESMVQLAAEHNVPVILFTVPVNLRDWHPNVSSHSVSGATLTQWEAQFRAGRAALLQADPQGAIEALQEAIRLDPLHAESHFYLARTFEQVRDYDAALAQYSQARDLDYNPFRALSDFHATVRDVAARHGNVHLLDAAEVVHQSSAPFAPGFDLFLDYVHPTKRGNLVIAEAVFDQIVRDKLIGQPTGDRHFTYIPEAFEPDGGPYDEARDFHMLGMLMHLFGMMHQNESLLDKATYLLNAPGAIEKMRPVDARLVGNAVEIFSDYMDLDRRQLRGVAVDPNEQARLERRTEAFYREYYTGYAGIQDHQAN